jgi:nickel/cobalt transporter (NicO) family protein
MQMTFALAGVAAGVGALHTLAPDHWVPFAALGRAEGWSARRTALVTAGCGLGHVTVSVLLGAASLVLGLELMQAVGARLENLAGMLLIGFGVAYGAWGTHRAMRDRIHGQLHDVLPGHHHHHCGQLDLSQPRQHSHAHHHHHVAADGQRRTAWTLFLLFSADPCVAVVPLMFAAAPIGWGSTLLVVLAYEVATIATMVLLVVPMRAAAGAIRGQWADRYGDAIAGAVIASVGVVVAVLGI